MELILFIGIQASGKSTFYQQNFFKTHLRINLDMLKTRHREEVLIEACLKTKQRLVIDNTNITKEARRKYFEGAKTAGFKVVGYYFEPNLTESLRRNSLRLKKENIPEIGIRGTLKKLEPPEEDEGFSKLYSVILTSDNEFKVKRIDEQQKKNMT